MAVSLGSSLHDNAAGVAAPSGSEHAISDEELGRAEAYRVLALLLAAPPQTSLLDDLGRIEGDDTALGQALRSLAATARDSSAQAAKDEYEELFIGVPLARLMPYASYYLNGQLFGRALAELRMDLAQMGVARNENAVEPEDHMATLCEIMAGSILGSFADMPLALPRQAAFFDAHLLAWGQRFFDDLEAEGVSRFYKPVAGFGRTLFALEAEAFRMVAR